MNKVFTYSIKKDEDLENLIILAEAKKGFITLLY